MNVQEHFLIAEMNHRTREGERRGQLEAALAEAQQKRPSLRARTAMLLVSLADRLSPEAVVAFEERHPLPHA